MTANYAHLWPSNIMSSSTQRIIIIVGKVLYLFLSECEELFQTIDINLLINGYHFVAKLRKILIYKNRFKKKRVKKVTKKLMNSSCYNSILQYVKLCISF